MSLNGIDIADWQRGIDLSAVPYDFCIVKANEGTAGNYPTLHEQADAVLANGRLLGLYHFARTGDAVAQAQVFVNEIRQYIGKAALFLDWENAGDYDLTVLSQGPGWAKSWLDEVYRLTGVRPMIYMSKSVCREYDWSAVAPDYALWMAQYPNYDPTGYQSDPWTDGGGAGAFSSWAIHQYASSGVLPGYDGDLDLDIFYGDAEAWHKFAAVNGNPSVPAPSPAPDCSIENLAQRVINGEFGNNEARKQALGDLYDIVQQRVNEILNYQAVDYYDLALRTIRGEFGNGEDRKRRLGTNYDKVQEIVDDAYSKVDATINGEYGNGQDRINNLGNIFPVVQELVNQRY